MPLVLSLAGFAAGIASLQQCAALPAPAWGPLALALLLVAWAFVHARRSRVGVVAFVAAAVLGGVGYAALRAQERLADELPAEWEGVDLRIVGVVDDLPRRSERGPRFAFAVERTITRGAQVPSRVSLVWPALPPIDDSLAARMPEPRAGERWSLAVRLKRPHGNYNDGGLDLEAWLLERNLRATGYVREDADNVRLAAFAGRPLDYVQRTRESIRDRALAALDRKPYAAVLVALAIGDQSGIAESAWTVFNRTGTGHLISISGLHVTVFATMAGGIAYALARRSTTLTSRIAARRAAALFAIAAAFGYVLIAGAEIPAQRTLLMLAVTALGLWLGRPGSGFVVWLWALVVVLACDPWAVLAAGFWLSFFAVGLLIYVGSGRCDDERRPTRLARLRRTLGEAARSQWAITAGLVPLSLALFGQVSLVGPLANAIAIPSITFVIVPLALGASASPLAEPWLVAHAALAPLMRLLDALAALPGAAWLQHAPPTWAVVLGVAAIALVLAPRGVPGRWLGAVALLPLALVAPDAPDHGRFRLAVLDVGQGTAVVVRTRAHALVYDAGPRWTEASDAGGRIVAPYLRAAGIRTLDALVISHRDLDHAGGALSLLDAVPVGFLLSSLDDGHEIVQAHAERGLGLRCMAGQAWEWDGVRFDVLFPERAHHDDRWRKSNDLSCVLRVSAGATAALLTGDIEATSEIDLLILRRESLRADVLIVPHHGSRTSSTASFVEAVSPAHAVFTVGYRNRFGHPRADVVARYAARDARVHRTDRSGAITFEIGPHGPGPPSAARVYRARYWHAARDAHASH